MATLGLHLHKGFLRYALLEGTKSSPLLAASNRLATPDPRQVPELMDWYDTHFNQLIDDHSPTQLAYRLIQNVKGDQLFFAEFPLGVLNLIAFRRDLPISCLAPRSLNPSALNLPRTTNLIRQCDTVFGHRPPGWDDHQNNAVLAAWFAL